jgi:hypothetical protein
MQIKHNDANSNGSDTHGSLIYMGKKGERRVEVGERRGRGNGEETGR